MLSMMSALTVATVIITPRYLRADQNALPTAPARMSEHQAMLENLAALIGGCAEVLAIHEPGQTPGQIPGDTPFTEVVLWLEDGQQPGEINTHEIAILSHSRVMQTIVCTLIGPADVPESDWADGVIDRSQAMTRSFAARFRRQPAAVMKLIGSTVSDVRFEWNSEGDDSPPLLWISLSWASDSVDGIDEASLFVDVLSSHGINQE